MVALLVLATGCVGENGPAVSDLVDESTVDLLVPVDERFAATWQFTVNESPDNYSIRSNWSPEFDPAIDPDLLVTGYQVNDPATFSGRADAEDPSLVEALDAVIVDHRSPDTGGPCHTMEADVEVVSCSYDGNVGAIPLLVRTVRNGSGETLVIVFDGTPGARQFITGEFRPVPVDSADRWLFD